MMRMIRQRFFQQWWISLIIFAAIISITASLRNSSPPKIPPAPSVSVPVYSLATRISSSQSANTTSSNSMNIVTFATPVSINPKLYMISLYYGTKTKDVFFECKYGILQLLDKNQRDLVPILGKRSGYETGYNKENECDRIGFPWETIRVIEPNSKPFSTKRTNTNTGDGLDEKDAACTTGDDDQTQQQQQQQQQQLRVFDGMKILPKCQLYIGLEMIDSMDAGDHEIALCKVVGVGEWSVNENCVISIDEINEEAKTIKAKDEYSVLYTGYLRKEGIL